MRSFVMGALVLFAAAAAPLRAQPGCNPSQFTVLIVDPVNGNPAGPGTAASPFLRLNDAIGFVLSASLPRPALIIALPGVYSTATNGEALPVYMPDGVHVRGIGAKECVLRGGGTFGPVIPQSFRPTFPGLGTTGNFEIGFAFTNDLVDPLSFAERSVENFTIQGCLAQTYINGDFAMTARISNCLFDMRDGLEVPGAVVTGPDFGILMVNDARFVGEPPVVGYGDVSPKIFNNTFIQASAIENDATKPPFTTVGARAESVAICDANNPAPGGILIDPTPFLFGPSMPSIQNNLIRTLREDGTGAQIGTALLGVTDDDTQVFFGTVVGPTNAFNPVLVGGFNATGTYQSQIIGATPVPLINTGFVDPAFVGESVGSRNVALGLPFIAIDDFRLMPDSAMVDVGSSPVGCVLIAGNFTVYSEQNSISFHHGVGSFDFDGEGFGNRRIVSMLSGVEEVDIGFDEADTLVVAGSYANGSKSHFLPWDPTIAVGDTNRWYIAPQAGVVPLLDVDIWWTPDFFPPATGPGYEVYPGLNIGAGPPFFFWLAAPSLLFTLQLLPDSVTDPLGGLHSFMSTIVTIGDFSPTTLFANEQGVYLDPATGTFPHPIPPYDRLTNAQSEHF